ncbi:MAG: phosphoribosyltransferase [Candidatus Bathyarchaeota archaeon]|nr:phosphoribosyltransferase [Candidatus Bathyarchaeota archaeon]
MAGETAFEAPSWSQIYTLLLSQSKTIVQSGFSAQVLVGVCRGGWICARVLSDLLENPNLASVKAQNYTSIRKTLHEPVLTQMLSADVKGKRVLVVDEVADSGKSLQLITKHINAQGAAQTKTATLYAKPQSIVKPDFCEKYTECWVVFPWELKETARELWATYKTPNQLSQQAAKLSTAGAPADLLQAFFQEFTEEEAQSC